MSVTIYHNPACGTSRNALDLLQRMGAAPRVVEYLKTPPTRDELADLAGRAGLPLRALLRQKGTPYAELGLDDPALSDAALLDHMLAQPILINRPLVASARGVALCRPSDLVMDLVAPPAGPILLKEEGVPVLLDRPIAGDDPDLKAALHAADLPITDLAEPGRSFRVFRTTTGEVAGYAGVEHCGPDVLLRSVVVRSALRGTGIGRNLVALMLRRAYDAGARRAWLLTTTAVPFFAKAGFAATERATAPEAILATREAASLCPASAALMTRAITL